MDPRQETRRGLEYHPVNAAILQAFSRLLDSRFVLDGVPVDMVEIIFKVEDVSESPSRYDLQFSDETGAFVGVIYKKSDRPSPALRGYDLRRKEYASAVGNVKRFIDTTALVIAKIVPIRLYSEVLNHRLRVIWAHNVRIGRLAKPRMDLSNFNTEIMAVIRELNPYRNRRGVPKSAILSQLDSQISPSELESRLNEMLAGGYLCVGDQEGCYLVHSP